MEAIMFKLDDLIIDISSWIDENVHRPMSVDDVVSRSGYSKAYLQRVFRKVTGKSIATYIRDEKLNLVTRDLVDSHDSIHDICFRYGYASTQSLTRIFTKKNKIPPCQFREKSISLTENFNSD
jgi:AraC family multidrug resistance transcriptional activator